MGGKNWIQCPDIVFEATHSYLSFSLPPSLPLFFIHTRPITLNLCQLHSFKAELWLCVDLMQSTPSPQHHHFLIVVLCQQVHMHCKVIRHNAENGASNF